MKHLSPTQLESLKLHLDNAKPYKAMLRILMETGIRADELAKARLQDLDLTTRALSVRGSKGSRDRTMFISAQTLLDLFSIGFETAHKRDSSQSLMVLCRPAYAKAAEHERTRYNAKQWLREQWRDLREALGLPEMGMHSLRHTVAVTLLRATDDIRKVQVTLGHKNINNTLKYLEELDQTAVAEELALLMDSSQQLNPSKVQKVG